MRARAQGLPTIKKESAKRGRAHARAWARAPRREAWHNVLQFAGRLYKLCDLGCSVPAECVIDYQRKGTLTFLAPAVMRAPA
mmetsp:Transcript_12593/g.38484  ORF Transcript_12593/g.38484 Transcript_12593/m.38484 type:complete len:82 (-) Transcript_12593:1897-2142(-)|eukprot:scaffold134770_cov33-Tisochrysis_lutea.AAC.1